VVKYSNLKQHADDRTLSKEKKSEKVKKEMHKDINSAGVLCEKNGIELNALRAPPVSLACHMALIQRFCAMKICCMVRRTAPNYYCVQNMTQDISKINCTYNAGKFKSARSIEKRYAVLLNLLATSSQWVFKINVSVILTPRSLPTLVKDICILLVNFNV
jgi:hypothetical protein